MNVSMGGKLTFVFSVSNAENEVLLLRDIVEHGLKYDVQGYLFLNWSCQLQGWCYLWIFDRDWK